MNRIQTLGNLKNLKRQIEDSIKKGSNNREVKGQVLVMYIL